MDCRVAGAWVAARLLRATSAAARLARPDPSAHSSGSRARQCGQPYAEGAGMGQHQALLGGDRHHGRVGSCNACGAV